MSYVTSVFLIVDFESDEKIRQACAFEYEARSGIIVPSVDLRAADGRLSGGTKFPGAAMYWGGLNFFPWWKWFEHLSTVEWRSPRSVLAVIVTEDGEMMTWRPEGADQGAGQ